MTRKARIQDVTAIFDAKNHAAVGEGLSFHTALVICGYPKSVVPTRFFGFFVPGLSQGGATLFATLLAFVCHAQAATADKPNIVYILTDDLGYGDVQCLGGERSKIPTPNLDRLAAAGIIFTDAHSSSAVCTPILPTKDWQGKSGLGAYGDFVMETDWAVGKVLAALETAGVADKTLVIFTSDNGCSPQAGVAQLQKQGHFPSEQRRGLKADIFDGGHRVPFLVSWPAQVKPGSSSDQLICLTDLMATCAEILGTKLPDNAGEDSVSMMPILRGKATTPLREAVVHHSINGSFAIRQGPWKLGLCADSGGWSAPKPGSKEAAKLPPVQLYDMTQDIGERVNESKAHPQIVERLTRLLEKYVADGRSTPGAPQKNDVEILIRKQDTPTADSE
jgi:arylsulfatase A-like enzyme